MKSKLKTAMMLVVIMVSQVSFSQEKWSAEFRPNLAFPTEDIGEIEPKTGFGFELALSYNFMEHLGAYVGWGYNTFKTTTNITEIDNDLDMTGYTFGLQFIHPVKEGSNFSYLIRAGGIYNHLEFENADGDIFEDTDHGLGYEFGLGLDYTFAETWHIRPQFGYRVLSRAIDLEGASQDVNLNYISFGVGIVTSF